MKRGDGLSPSGGLINELSTRKAPSLLCFSHLRWNFVFQRPQHLMTHAARSWRVFFWEEPVWVDPETESGLLPRLELRRCDGGVVVATPVLPYSTGDDFICTPSGNCWISSCKSNRSTRLCSGTTPRTCCGSLNHLSGSAIVYDCMDELSAFRGAVRRSAILEQSSADAADLVFTGGHSLYEAKRQQHASVHRFSEQCRHGPFCARRAPAAAEPDDQAAIPHPRLGFLRGHRRAAWTSALLAAVAICGPIGSSSSSARW